MERFKAFDQVEAGTLIIFTDYAYLALSGPKEVYRADSVRQFDVYSLTSNKVMIMTLHLDHLIEAYFVRP